MISSNDVRADVPVVCSEGGAFATVDHMEGEDTIKLKKDEQGRHHFIPLEWVTAATDEEVRIDRPGTEAMQAWTTEAKGTARL